MALPKKCLTALMYAFAQREDTQVFDEPLYAHYLKVSGAIHPGREKVLQALENDGDKVVQKVILQKSDMLLFHKLMTHFLIGIDTEFLSEVVNIVLIRNPEEIITSYSKVIPNPRMNDIGVKQQYELFVDLERRGIEPIVLDSKYLLKNPKLILSKLCKILDVSFDEKMLKWKKGARKEDGVWASYWYKNIHNSTGFLPYAKKEITLTGSNKELAEECLAYYEFLTAKSI